MKNCVWRMTNGGWTLVLLCGCVTPPAPREIVRTEPSRVEPPPASMHAIPEALIERPEYVLTAGDRIAVRFVPRPREAAPREYRLSAGDQIDVRFPLEPRYDQQPVVQPDGRVRLVLIGPLRAAGLTLEQLGEQMRTAYGRYLREPELTVDLKAMDPRLEEIRRALTSETRQMPIKSDGTIDLPYIGEVRAAGRTVEALRVELGSRCEQAGLEDAAVSVVIESFAPRQLYVTGEVRTPGRISTDAPTSLIQAIATSGGITSRGDPRRVLLIRRLGLPQPGSIMIDVQRLLDAALENAGRGLPARFDPWLADGDIIYVPPLSADKPTTPERGASYP